MLILKVVKHHFYGGTHPTGQALECVCYKINENLNTKEIEDFIEMKTRGSSTYTKISWEIMKVEEEEWKIY